MKKHLRNNILFYLGIALLALGAFSLFLPYYKDNKIEFTLFKIIFGGNVNAVINNVTYSYTFSLNVFLTILFIIKSFTIIFLLIIKKDKRNLYLFIIIALVNLITSTLLTLSIYIQNNTLPIETSSLMFSYGNIINIIMVLLGISLISYSYIMFLKEESK